MKCNFKKKKDTFHEKKAPDLDPGLSKIVFFIKKYSLERNHKVHQPTAY